jgi:haloalkane dehalogenase
VEKKKLFLNGKVVAYLELGKENDDPVMFLHGVPESSLIWKEMLKVTASSGYRAIAPDLPGFGDSDSFKESPTWKRYEQFITEFTHELGIDRVHLVVHDWGGLIGLRWATLHLNKVSSLFISSSTISEEYRWHKLAQMWRTPGIGEETMKKLSDWNVFYDAMKPSMPFASEEELKDFFKVFQSSKSSSVILELYRSGNSDEIKIYAEELSLIKAPVTIVWGEKDPYVPVEFAQKLKNDHIPHAKVFTIPDASHFIQLEVPDLVKTYLKHHLDSEDVRGRIDNELKEK